MTIERLAETTTEDIWQLCYDGPPVFNDIYDLVEKLIEDVLSLGVST